MIGSDNDKEANKKFHVEQIQYFESLFYVEHLLADYVLDGATPK